MRVYAAVDEPGSVGRYIGSTMSAVRTRREVQLSSAIPRSADVQVLHVTDVDSFEHLVHPRNVVVMHWYLRDTEKGTRAYEPVLAPLLRDAVSCCTRPGDAAAHLLACSPVTRYRMVAVLVARSSAALGAIDCCTREITGRHLTGATRNPDL